MDAEMGGGIGEGAVEHQVVGTKELAARHDLEAQGEHVAAVDGVGIRIMDLEGGNGVAEAVDGLLDVRALEGTARGKRSRTSRGRRGGRGEEMAAGGIAGENGGALQLEGAAQS